MKILYTASTERHIHDFHLPVINGLIDEGFDVYIVCRNADRLQGDYHKISIPFAKSYFSLNNIKAWIGLYRLFNKNDFDIVSTHTALSGFITRSALMFSGKKNVYCVHTAHGYLFGKKVKLFGRITYPLEKFCRFVTDVIITMNAEDYIYAKKLVRKGGQVIQSFGMGVDLERYKPCPPKEKVFLRKDYKLPEGFLIFYAAEFSSRKNHKALLQAMPEILNKIPNVYLLLAGDGALREKMSSLAIKLGITDRVVFLGYVADTSPYLRASDMAVSVSLSEGLPLNISEALAAGVPTAASRVKGHIDLLADGVGLLFDPRSPSEISACCMAIASGVKMEKPHINFQMSKMDAAKQFLKIYDLK